MAEARSSSGRLTVDNNNWESCKGYIPTLGLKQITLVARDGATKPLPVADIASVVQDCELVLRFVDNFYEASDATLDLERLQLLRSGQGLKIKVFYGYLNQAGMDTLPPTIFELGLGIGNLLDAEMISGMQTWDRLSEIRVSVNARVPVEDLRPLPRLLQLGLIFPALDDDRVDMVERAISALVPGNHLTVLHFPHAVLTAAGAMHLAETIRDMKDLYVDFEISIEPSGAWMPDDREKKTLGEIMKTRVGMGKVRWTMYWIYD